MTSSEKLCDFRESAEDNLLVKREWEKLFPVKHAIIYGLLVWKYRNRWFILPSPKIVLFNCSFKELSDQWNSKNINLKLHIKSTRIGYFSLFFLSL